MITSFRHKGLKRLFVDGDASKINPQHVEAIRVALSALYQAASLSDLSSPSFKTHPLKGEQKGRYSMLVQSGWSITFEFESGEAKRVDYEQYHRGHH